jgi:SAM-dependent methyltransferase
MDVQVPEEPALTAGMEYTIRDQQLMSAATRYFRWQANLARKEIGQRVLEVGCGIGNFTNTLTDRELVFCTDAERACIHRHRSRFHGFPNIESLVLDVADPAFTELSRMQPDSIVCMNVLEHVRDHHQAIQNMRSILEPGGKIVLLLPAFPTLYGPIDRNLGHCRRYTGRGVKALANSAGLRIRRLIYLNLAGFFGWWVNTNVLAREEHSKAQIRIFDRYIVPVQSRLEELIPPPFGLSIFAVFEKP